jgi:hypothetical protein
MEFFCPTELAANLDEATAANWVTRMLFLETREEITAGDLTIKGWSFSPQDAGKPRTTVTVRFLR